MIPDEQKLCKSCGFCCDRTLFDYANIDDDELRFKDQGFKISSGGKYFSFEQPCSHFCKFCTIYDEEKPRICGAFKCKMLTKLSKGKVELDEALQTVKEIMLERDKLVSNFNSIADISINSFREGLYYLENEANNLSDKMSELKLHFELLNVHLTKHFKSEGVWTKYYSNE